MCLLWEHLIINLLCLSLTTQSSVIYVCYRVLDHQSFFSAIVEVPLEEHMFVEEKHYCKCELNDNSKPQLPGQVVCDYDQDFSNCQSDIEIMRGIDITEQIIITPHFRRKRRDIDAGKNDIPMDDYFSSTFSYDAHFVGQVSKLVIFNF